MACDNGFWVVVLICGACVFAPGFPVALGVLYFRAGFCIFYCFHLVPQDDQLSTFKGVDVNITNGIFFPATRHKLDSYSFRSIISTNVLEL